MKKSLVTAGLCLCILGPMSGVHAVVPEGFFQMIVDDPQSALAAFGPSRAGFTDKELDVAEEQIPRAPLYGKFSTLTLRALINLQTAIETERAERIGADPAARIAEAAAAAGLWDAEDLSEELVSDDDTEPGGAAAADR